MYIYKYNIYIYIYIYNLNLECIQYVSCYTQSSVNIFHLQNKNINHK